MDASGFEPIALPTAKVLVLGTLPGQISLRRREYYANPHNAFWRIVESLFGIPAEIEYAERTRRLSESGVALWDVCAAANRPGSLDLSIRPDSVIPNDFASFMKRHRQIALIGFNGAKAGALFRKHVKLTGEVPLVDLPSTSPANAAMPFSERLNRWSVVRQRCET